MFSAVSVMLSVCLRTNTDLETLCPLLWLAKQKRWPSVFWTRTCNRNEQVKGQGHAQSGSPLAGRHSHRIHCRTDYRVTPCCPLILLQGSRASGRLSQSPDTFFLQFTTNSLRRFFIRTTRKSRAKSSDCVCCFVSLKNVFLESKEQIQKPQLPLWPACFEE